MNAYCRERKEKRARKGIIDPTVPLYIVEENREGSRTSEGATRQNTERERERRWKRFLVNKLLYAKAWENSILERKREKAQKNGKSKEAEDRE